VAWLTLRKAKQASDASANNAGATAKRRGADRGKPLFGVLIMSLQSYAAAATPSPLVLSDHLLSLAEEADRAGCKSTAEHLLSLAHSVFDEKIHRRQ
jgi:hypothetical protein